MLMTSDKDTPFEKLKFRIIKPPANGNLIKVVDGKDNLMLANAVFSPKELIEGRIRFHHDALKPLEGKIFLMQEPFITIQVTHYTSDDLNVKFVINLLETVSCVLMKHYVVYIGG